MQALTKGAMTVFGGSQIRPNIHIDDLVDAYLYLFEHRIGGVYNAGFENLTVLDIANRVAERVPAEVKVLPSSDPRSYRICSDRLVAAGFAPKKSVASAIEEIVAAHRDGWLRDEPVTHNVTWMKQHNLG
jgi:nucleoside-diphosphate-sugar epimerase